ncbi:MAG: hypothetical protein CVV05_17205 [Gammaproteobacteria bacterium HGW-Gammaproteobacteria-1]|jgi:hypothetical protein|nr:MAG: hypothetical protein CVV05_17205 [Gammaproteobacteria bacterium HGW-Gammaproteobacteria-1]
MAASHKLSPAGRLIFGALFVLAGLFPALAAFDIGPLHAADIHGPPWLGLAGGGVFIAAGMAVLVGDAVPALKNVFALLVLAGLAALGNWIAFGAGERACAGTMTFLWFAADSGYAGVACRVPFGLGAVIVDAFLILAAVMLLQQALGGAPQLARTTKAAQGLLLLTLSPLLLLVLVMALLPVALGVLWQRLRSGRWPRNEEFIRRRR